MTIARRFKIYLGQQWVQGIGLTETQIGVQQTIAATDLLGNRIGNNKDGYERLARSYFKATFVIFTKIRRQHDSFLIVIVIGYPVSTHGMTQETCLQ